MSGNYQENLNKILNGNKDFENKYKKQLDEKSDFCKEFNNKLSELKKALESDNFEKQVDIMLSIIPGIIENFGPHSYNFICFTTKIAEACGLQLKHTITAIIRQEKFRKNYDNAFCAFYILCVCYARTHKKSEMKEFVQQHYADFSDYPLLAEVDARWLQLNGDYWHQYYRSKYAQQQYEKLPGYKTDFFKTPEENNGILISQAEAILSILDYCFVHEDFAAPKPKTITYEGEFSDSASMITAKTSESENNVYTKYYNIQFFKEQNENNQLMDLCGESIVKAITFRSDYAKYYYLLAKFVFYNEIIKNLKEKKEDVYKLSCFDNIISLLNKAVNTVQRDSKDGKMRIEQYLDFRAKVEGIHKYKNNSHQKLINCEQKKYDVLNAYNIKMASSVLNNIYDRSKNKQNYIFVSYSSADYLKVYCDIIELDYRNINVAFDHNLNEVEIADNWEKSVEKLIRGASMILCYISEDYFSSAPVCKELQLAEHYNKKIVSVSLCDTCNITTIIANAIKNNKNISTESLKTITSVFNDKMSVISRDPAPTAISHIIQIKNALKSNYPEVLNYITTDKHHVQCCLEDAEGALHKKHQHPYEDAFVCDSDYDIYIVADGITRPDIEYLDNHEESVAKKVSDTFCKECHSYIKQQYLQSKDPEDIPALLKNAFRYANDKCTTITENPVYNNINRPGCVAIVAVIVNDKLFFGSVGDCMGIIIRNGRKIIFSPKQTTYALEILKTPYEEKPKYINNKDSAYGYGVVNGDSAAEYFFNPTYIELHHNDDIYLMSDGISDYIEYTSNDTLKDETLEALCEKSYIQDKEMHLKKFDDKTIIRIKYRTLNE